MKQHNKVVCSLSIFCSRTIKSKNKILIFIQNFRRIDLILEAFLILFKNIIELD